MKTNRPKTGNAPMRLEALTYCNYLLFAGGDDGI